MGYYSTVYWEFTPEADAEFQDLVKNSPKYRNFYTLHDILSEATRYVLKDGTITYFMRDVKWYYEESNFPGVDQFNQFLLKLGLNLPAHEMPYSFYRIGEEETDIEFKGNLQTCHVHLQRVLVGNKYEQPVKPVKSSLREEAAWMPLLAEKFSNDHEYYKPEDDELWK